LKDFLSGDWKDTGYPPDNFSFGSALIWMPFFLAGHLLIICLNWLGASHLPAFLFVTPAFAHSFSVLFTSIFVFFWFYSGRNHFLPYQSTLFAIVAGLAVTAPVNLDASTGMIEWESIQEPSNKIVLTHADTML
jgi:hypothetical protein